MSNILFKSQARVNYPSLRSWAMDCLLAYGDESEDESFPLSGEGITPLRGSQSQSTNMSTDSSISLSRNDSDFIYDEEMPEDDGTPQYYSSPKEVEEPVTPRSVEETKKAGVPPAPNTPVDPVVKERFRLMWKARGEKQSAPTIIPSLAPRTDVPLCCARFLKTTRDFSNPSIYELFIESHKIKEFGSNFSLEQYDPEGFPQECYYDYIAKRQNDAMLKKNAAAAAKKAAAGEDPAVKRPKLKEAVVHRSK